MASVVGVACLAMILLVLVRHLTQVPMNGSRLAAPLVVTILEPPNAVVSPVRESRAVSVVPMPGSSPVSIAPPPRLPAATPRAWPAYTATPAPSPTDAPDDRLEASSTPPASPATPTRSRDGCDPAYPDERTCIPPGPPFAQGCAITDERRFTVLPPDPQRLDHDGDGIGCEPVS